MSRPATMRPISVDIALTRARRSAYYERARERAVDWMDIEDERVHWATVSRRDYAGRRPR